MSFLTQIQWPDASGLLEILVLSCLFYYIILFFRGTRGAQVLSGFTVALVFLMVLTQLFHLDTLTWLLKRFFVYMAVALLVIFQPEIRRALAELGKQHVFVSTRSERSLVDHLVQATLILSERKIGALIAVEREIGTRGIQETGTRIDSIVSPELLASIFFPHTPLHDGGVVIRSGRVAFASCVFPLSQREDLSKSLGTRHRAAVGLTEETDAIVIVVSEETGTISIAYRGRLSRGLDEERLRRVLTAVLVRGKQSKSSLSRAQDQLDVSAGKLAETEGFTDDEEDTEDAA